MHKLEKKERSKNNQDRVITQNTFKIEMMQSIQFSEKNAQRSSSKKRDKAHTYKQKILFEPFKKRQKPYCLLKHFLSHLYLDMTENMCLLSQTNGIIWSGIKNLFGRIGRIKLNRRIHELHTSQKPRHKTNNSKIKAVRTESRIP